jgi:hypothetical protein
LFVTLAWIVVGLQAVSFFIIDARFPPRSKALYHYSGTDDIIEISLLEDTNPMGRYSIWVALAEVAPESTLYLLNPGDRVSSQRAYSFGLADDVVFLPRADATIEGTDFLDDVVAKGPGAEKGPPWMIVLNPSGPPAGDVGDPADFLTEALAGDQRGTDPDPPREFVLLAWRGEPLTGEAAEYWDRHRVLMETSFLTDAQRERYGIPQPGMVN